MAFNVDALPEDPQLFSTYVSELDDKQLQLLESRLTERFGELRESDHLDEDTMARLTTIRDQVMSTKSEMTKRDLAAKKTRAEEAAAAHRAALDELSADVFGSGKKKDPAEDEEKPEDGDEVENLATKFAEAFGKALDALPITAAGVRGSDLNKHVREMPLNRVSQFAPDPKLAAPRKEAVLVASADIPGVAKNGIVNGINQLVTLMGDRARMLPVTRGGAPNYVAVAKMQRDFRYRLSLDSTPDEVNEVLTAATDVSALVAAGGWCAPSEISYDFFNIVCEDGLVDLPSVGILNRGGFRYPQSPSIADIFSTSSSAIWTWTEEDDEDAVDSDSVLKTCARVVCPSFDEVRAACYGLCVTAGNLTDYAYPELIENFVRLVMAARAHSTNQTILSGLASGSTAVSMLGSEEGAASSVLNAVELQAVDYRNRFRMCEDAILEAVFPSWILGTIRADLANRNGVNLLDVTNAQIADWLNLRNVRAQFVQDWQAGSDGNPIGDPDTIATAWPATANFLIYAPGTWVRGQALQLDLGVVRDSRLNETNDHTAAWMEDCFAIAQVGHESRNVAIDLCTLGVTGAPVLECAAS